MKRSLVALASTSLALATGLALASSHREAPLIVGTPQVDATDLYMFRSYESGRSGYVVLIANYQPLQDPGAGPIYYPLDGKATYSIHVDNNGDARPDLTFEFHPDNNYQGLTVPVGNDGAKQQIAVPLVNIGPFGPGLTTNDAVKNRIENYTITQVRHGTRTAVKNLSLGGTGFRKPMDNIGEKSIPQYGTYADNHRFVIGLDGCASVGRVFVGQRREGFSVAVGPIFDLINLNPVGSRSAEGNSLKNKNITTFALEIPIACLTAGGGPIIGAWTTAGKKDAAGTYRQMSRLSAPLVNEVIIGMPDKDEFNRSMPTSDGLFAKYVTHPSLPELIQILFPSVQAPNKFPRTDLVAAFLTGIPGLNQPVNVVPAEMMRLNTTIAPRAASAQNNLGVLGGDNAGFPNGRRPGDDVVDIELRVAMGVLLTDAEAPSGKLPYTDGAPISATEFLSRFPFLTTPLPGSRL